MRFGRGRMGWAAVALTAVPGCADPRSWGGGSLDERSPCASSAELCSPAMEAAAPASDDAAASAGPAAHTRGLLLARPLPTNTVPRPAGKTPLGLAARRDGFVYAPALASRGPLPLLVFMHGLGGNAAQADALLTAAEKAGVLILSIDSRGATWDLVLGDVGPDVAFLDKALRLTFERYAVDATRMALSGFSDGASYALSIGLNNGALFSHVLAFSPGFASPSSPNGRPRLFVSHGTSDRVLPIDACSRRIVPRLRRSGYEVEYHEFDAGHTMPARVLDTAFAWLLE